MRTRALVLMSLAGLVALLTASGTGSSASMLTPVVITQPHANPFGQGLTPRADGVEVRWVEFSEADEPSFYSRTSMDFGRTYSEAEDVTAEYDYRNPGDDDEIFSYVEAITAGHIYQTWNDGEIKFRQSEDDGLTWSQPMVVDDGADLFGPYITAAGQNVFILWDDLDQTLYGRSSDDAGMTWGPRVELADVERATWDAVATPDGGVILARFGFEAATLMTYPSTDLAQAPLEKIIDTELPVVVDSKSVSGSLETPDGGAVLAHWTWSQGDEHQEMFTSTLDQGESWRTEREVWRTSTEIFAATAFGVVGDAWHFVWAPIEDFDLPSDVFMRTVRDDGATLGGEVHVSSTESLPYGLDVVELDGKALVHWAEDTGPDSSTLSLASIAAPVGPPSVSRIELGYRASGPVVVSAPASPAAVAPGSPLGYIYWVRDYPAAGDDPRMFQIYAAPIGITGDTDCNGGVTQSDIAGVLRDVGGLAGDSACAEAGDVDCDGERTPIDALIMLYAGTALPQPFADVICARVGT